MPLDLDSLTKSLESLKLSLQTDLQYAGTGDARNMTSHTYGESQANAVYEAAKKFLASANELKEALGKSND